MVIVQTKQYSSKVGNHRLRMVSRLSVDTAWRGELLIIHDLVHIHTAIAVTVHIPVLKCFV